MVMKFKRGDIVAINEKFIERNKIDINQFEKFNKIKLTSLMNIPLEIIIIYNFGKNDRGKDNINYVVKYGEIEAQLHEMWLKPYSFMEDDDFEIK
jgi:hypothetical protein